MLSKILMSLYSKSACILCVNIAIHTNEFGSILPGTSIQTVITKYYRGTICFARTLGIVVSGWISFRWIETRETIRSKNAVYGKRRLLLRYFSDFDPAFLVDAGANDSVLSYRKVGNTESHCSYFGERRCDCKYLFSLFLRSSKRQLCSPWVHGFSFSNSANQIIAIYRNCNCNAVEKIRICGAVDYVRSKHSA